MTNLNYDKELSWDDEISQESQYILLPKVITILL